MGRISLNLLVIAVACICQSLALPIVIDSFVTDVKVHLSLESSWEENELDQDSSDSEEEEVILLTLTLDFMTVCLATERFLKSVKEGAITDYPKCTNNGLMCLGPRGPKQIWTSHRVLNEAERCLTAFTQQTLCTHKNLRLLKPDDLKSEITRSIQSWNSDNAEFPFFSSVEPDSESELCVTFSLDASESLLASFLSPPDLLTIEIRQKFPTTIFNEGYYFYEVEFLGKQITACFPLKENEGSKNRMFHDKLECQLFCEPENDITGQDEQGALLSCISDHYKSELVHKIIKAERQKEEHSKVQVKVFITNVDLLHLEDPSVLSVGTNVIHMCVVGGRFEGDYGEIPQRWPTCMFVCGGPKTDVRMWTVSQVQEAMERCFESYSTWLIEDKEVSPENIGQELEENMEKVAQTLALSSEGVSLDKYDEYSPFPDLAVEIVVEDGGGYVLEGFLTPGELLDFDIISKKAIGGGKLMFMEMDWLSSRWSLCLHVTREGMAVMDTEDTHDDVDDDDYADELCKEAVHCHISSTDAYKPPWYWTAESVRKSIIDCLEGELGGELLDRLQDAVAAYEDEAQFQEEEEDTAEEDLESARTEL